MTCDRFVETFGEGALDPLAMAHLASCRSCRELSERYRETVHLADLATRFETTQAMEDAFIRRAWRQRSPTTRPRARWSRTAGTALLTVAAAAGLAFLMRTSSPPERMTPEEDPLVYALTAQTGELSVNGEPAQPGALLSNGARLHAKTEVRLTQDDAVTLALTPATELLVDTWQPDQTRLLLSAGTVHVSLDRHPSFEVATENATVRVVGTDFSVTWTPRLRTHVVVRSGIVRVEAPDGQLLSALHRGEELTVPETEPPESAPPEVVPTPLVPAAAVPVAAPATPTEPASSTDASPEPDVVERVRVLLARGHDDASIALLQTLPTDDWRRDALLGDAYTLGGRLEEAELAYTRALEHTEAPVETLLVDLAAVVETRDPPRAIELWERVLRLTPAGPTATRARLAIGTWELAEGMQPLRGEATLRAVLRDATGSSRIRAITLLLTAFTHQERWDDIEALVSSEPAVAEHPFALLSLARAHLERGRLAEARRLLQTYEHGDASRYTTEAAALRQALDAAE